MTSVALPPAPAAPSGYTPRAATRPPRPARLAAGLHARLDRLERVYAVALLLVFSDAVIPLVRSASGAVPDLENGDPHRQAMLFAFFGVCGLLCALRPRQVSAAALRNPLTLLLVGFAILSKDWSHAPDITLRRGIALAGTTMCGVWLAGRFRGRELMEILGWAMGIAAVLSLLLTGTSFSMQAYIGIIMLAGIVVSNAILLVDYINTLRRRDAFFNCSA